MGRFVSKAQWRAMHARYGHRGWVRRRARRQRGQYRALPPRSRRGGRRRK